MGYRWRISGADNNGIADLLGSIQSILNSAHSNGLCNGDVDLLQRLSKQISVLRDFERANARAQNLDAISFEKTHTLHLDTQIERGLPTEAEEDAIWALTLNDIAHILGCDGEVVDFVREDMGSLNSCNVGVNEDGSNAGFLECLERLRTCW